MISDPRFWAVYKQWSERTNCGFCPKEFEAGWVSYDDGITISGEAAFHWHDSHGLDKDIVEMILTDVFWNCVNDGRIA